MSQALDGISVIHKSFSSLKTFLMSEKNEVQVCGEPISNTIFKSSQSRIVLVFLNIISSTRWMVHFSSLMKKLTNLNIIQILTMFASLQQIKLKWVFNEKTWI